LFFGNVSVARGEADVAPPQRAKTATSSETASLPWFAGNRAATRRLAHRLLYRPMHLPHTLGKVTEQL
jgi:hypothetical protein